MIKYNPKEWFSLIFEFHKSDTLRKLIYIIVLYGLYTAAIVHIELHYTELKSTIAIHSLIGFVLGLLLVFRTNTAYDRWWEGRKLLGALVNTSRNLALKINTFLPEKETEKRKLFSQLISNYCFSMKNHLRDKKIVSELDLSSTLTEKELNVLLLREEGLLQQQIAKRLNITQSAVSRFEANAKAKIRDALTDLEVLRKLSIKHNEQPSGVDDKIKRWTK